jgi:hypothetical protein
MISGRHRAEEDEEVGKLPEQILDRVNARQRGEREMLL